MSIFSSIRKSHHSAKEYNAKLAEQKKKEEEAKVPYRHIPLHAASDAVASAPPSWREAADREKIMEQNRRRSAMPYAPSPNPGIMTGAPGPAFPRSSTSLSFVSYAGPSNLSRAVPRNHSYSGLSPYHGAGRDVIYSVPDISYPELSHSHGPGIVPVQTPSASSSSQEDLEMKRTAPPTAEAAYRHHVSTRPGGGFDASRDRQPRTNGPYLRAGPSSFASPPPGPPPLSAPPPVPQPHFAAPAPGPSPSASPRMDWRPTAPSARALGPGAASAPSPVRVGTAPGPLPVDAMVAPPTTAAANTTLAAPATAAAATTGATSTTDAAPAAAATMTTDAAPTAGATSPVVAAPTVAAAEVPVDDSSRGDSAAHTPPVIPDSLIPIDTSHFLETFVGAPKATLEGGDRVAQVAEASPPAAADVATARSSTAAASSSTGAASSSTAAVSSSTAATDSSTAATDASTAATDASMAAGSSPMAAADAPTTTADSYVAAPVSVVNHLPEPAEAQPVLPDEGQSKRRNRIGAKLTKRRRP